MVTIYQMQMASSVMTKKNVSDVAKIPLGSPLPLKTIDLTGQIG
jgi:hypothetical protein